MQIQINTDHNIKGHETFISKINQEIGDAFTHVSDHITRLEVYLTDENGRKKGQNDKRCVLEARLEGRPPIAVTYKAETLDHAVEGAIGKLIRLISAKLDRMRDRRRTGMIRR